MSIADDAAISGAKRNKKVFLLPSFPQEPFFAKCSFFAEVRHVKQAVMSLPPALRMRMNSCISFFLPVVASTEAEMSCIW